MPPATVRDAIADAGNKGVLALGLLLALGGALLFLGLQRLFLAFFLTVHALGHAKYSRLCEIGSMLRIIQTPLARR